MCRKAPANLTLALCSHENNEYKKKHNSGDEIEMVKETIRKKEVTENMKTQESTTTVRWSCIFAIKPCDDV